MGKLLLPKLASVFHLFICSVGLGGGSIACTGRGGGGGVGEYLGIVTCGGGETATGFTCLLCHIKT